MARRKKKSASVLGDDPLSWLGNDGTRGEQPARNSIRPDKQTDSAGIEQNISAAASHAGAGSEPVNITLDSVITLAEVSQLKESLSGHVSPCEIQIDVSKVEHIDTAGLQLLLAFSKAIEKQGGKLNWTGWSAAYADTVELLGLAAAIGVKKN